MKLLALSSWFPFPPDNGSRLRAFHLIRELARQGHQITLIAGQQADSPASVPPELAALCEPGAVHMVPWTWHEGKNLRGLDALDALHALLSPVPRAIRETPNPALTEAIAAQFARPDWDAVLVSEAGMDAYVPPFPPGLRVILDNVELSGMTHGEGGPRQQLAQAKARHYWQRRLQKRGYAALTAVSNEEEQIIRALIGASCPPVFVVPNGVEASAFPPRDVSTIVPNRLIFNGALTYGPNRDAVRWFAATVLPLIAVQIPSVHLVVTGRFDADRQHEWKNNPRLCLTGFVPDIRTELDKAAVCVVPLLGGGGTRLKILEAWAAGVPVVSTSVGARGLEGVNGTHFLSADTPEDFAKNVISLLRTPAQNNTLAENARALVETHYDWATIAQGLEMVLRGEK